MKLAVHLTGGDRILRDGRPFEVDRAVVTLAPSLVIIDGMFMDGGHEKGHFSAAPGDAFSLAENW